MYSSKRLETCAHACIADFYSSSTFLMITQHSVF